MSFSGLRVLSFESRRATEIAKLIASKKGDPFVAPSMREAPLEKNEAAFAVAERLFAGEFEMMILLTGVGTRYLDQLLATRYPEGQFAEALRKITVVARGPKPSAALREMKVPITVSVPEPNTWRELLAAIEGRPEKRVVVQEYGKTNQNLIDGLKARGAEVTQVPVYAWDLPEDLGPLREAIRRLSAGEVDVAMFTTSIQVEHLFAVAEEEGREAEVRDGLQNALLASIGPTTTETLAEHGLKPDLEPTHPKMGFLVQETAAKAHEILRSKRSAKEHSNA